MLLVDLSHQLASKLVIGNCLLHDLEALLEGLAACVLPERCLLLGDLCLCICSFLSLLLPEIELLLGFAFPTIASGRKLVRQGLLLPILLFVHLLL